MCGIANLQQIELEIKLVSAMDWAGARAVEQAAVTWARL